MEANHEFFTNVAPGNSRKEKARKQKTKKLKTKKKEKKTQFADSQIHILEDLKLKYTSNTFWMYSICHCLILLSTNFTFCICVGVNRSSHERQEIEINKLNPFTTESIQQRDELTGTCTMYWC